MRNLEDLLDGAPRQRPGSRAALAALADELNRTGAAGGARRRQAGGPRRTPRPHGLPHRARGRDSAPGGSTCSDRGRAVTYNANGAAPRPLSPPGGPCRQAGAPRASRIPDADSSATQGVQDLGRHRRRRPQAADRLLRTARRREDEPAPGTVAAEADGRVAEPGDRVRLRGRRDGGRPGRFPQRRPPAPGGLPPVDRPRLARADAAPARQPGRRRPAPRRGQASRVHGGGPPVGGLRLPERGGGGAGPPCGEQSCRR